MTELTLIHGLIDAYSKSSKSTNWIMEKWDYVEKAQQKARMYHINEWIAHAHGQTIPLPGYIVAINPDLVRTVANTMLTAADPTTLRQGEITHKILEFINSRHLELGNKHIHACEKYNVISNKRAAWKNATFASCSYDDVFSIHTCKHGMYTSDIEPILKAYSSRSRQLVMKSHESIEIVKQLADHNNRYWDNLSELSSKYSTHKTEQSVKTKLACWNDTTCSLMEHV